MDVPRKSNCLHQPDLDGVSHARALQQQVALARITSERRRDLELPSRFSEAAEFAEQVAPYARQENGNS